MNDAALNCHNSLKAIATLGKLHYAYLNCIGNKTLKAAYLPQKIRWYTVALWATTIVPAVAIAVLQFFVDPDWGWLGMLAQVAIMLFLYFPLAKYCIRNGLPDEHRELGITGVNTSHSAKLHLPFLKLLFFRRHVMNELQVGHEEIKTSIEVLELSTKDSPPSWSTYFRHPVPLLLISSLVVLINSRVSTWINATQMQSQTFLAVGLSITWVLSIGFILFTWRYSELESRWNFLRTLRWLELTTRPNTKSIADNENCYLY
ncbi:hypothetical protein [Massilia sp.]|uniref:hypothetical protein n=1 Tax=Massilia sp. TaxID=1882437 RepID=UPI0028A10BBE|nr:hypothetical protein [Massilia sp.]